MIGMEQSTSADTKGRAVSAANPGATGMALRKVVSGLFISLDGVTEAPDRWQFDNFDAQMMASLQAFIAAEDAVLMGRVTYQEWASYWPTSSDEPFASFINNIPKYIVSTTLDRVDWQNSTLLKGPSLKRSPG